MTDFLERITIETQRRVETLKKSQPLARLPQRSKESPRPFAAALRPSGGGLGLIAELKQASPSAGLIRKETDLPARLAAYERGGASALSILTEESYFHGSPQLLDLARRTVRLPLLRKDFIVDPCQIIESASLGADAILLIAAILTDSQLKEFLGLARENGLDALLEIHSEKELERALSAGASLIGINNRDLRTLEIDAGTAARLLPLVPKPGCTVVVESGVKEPCELERFHRSGAHAVLIGEALMRSPDPESLVRRFVEAGRAHPL